MTTTMTGDDHPLAQGRSSSAPPAWCPAKLATEVTSLYRDEDGKESIAFRVGDLVTVDARTWANINQPGGVARITSVISGSNTTEPTPNPTSTGEKKVGESGASSTSSPEPRQPFSALTRSGTAALVTALNALQAQSPLGVDPRCSNHRGNEIPSKSSAGQERPASKTAQFVSVRYVLDGRHERKVDVRYVRPYRLHSADERFRDRSTLLGRCTYCGSLRSDCGSCDQQRMLLLRQQQQRPAAGSTVIPPAAASRQKKDSRRVLDSQSSSDSCTDSSDSSSSQSLDLDMLLARHRKIDRMYAKLQARRRRWLDRQVWPGSAALGDRLRKKDPIRGQQKLVNGPRRRPHESDRRASSEDANSSSQSRMSSSLTREDSNGYVSNQGEVEEGSSDSDASSFSPLPTGRSDQPGGNEAESDRSQDRGSGDEVDQPDDIMFLQPEGNADVLPKDVVDQTACLRYHDLPEFFDDRVRSLRLELRSAKRELRDLERRKRWLDHKNLTISPVEWRRECITFHDKLVENLVRNGTDQCNRALRKLSSKRRFEQYLRRESMSAATDTLRDTGTLSKQDLQLDTRGFQLDSLSLEVETVVRRALMMARHVESDDEYPDEALSEDSGWAYPWSTSSSSSTPLMGASERSSEDDLSISLGARTAHEPIDPHLYATRKRKTSQRKRKESRILVLSSTKKRSKLPRRRQSSGKVSESFEEQEYLLDGADESSDSTRAAKRSRREKGAGCARGRHSATEDLSELCYTQTGQLRQDPSRKMRGRSDIDFYRHVGIQGRSVVSIPWEARDGREGTKMQRDRTESTVERLQRFLEVNKEHCIESVDDVEVPSSDRSQQGSSSLLKDSHLAQRKRSRVSSRRLTGAQTARSAESTVDMQTELFSNLVPPDDVATIASVSSTSIGLDQLLLRFSNTFPSDESVNVMVNIMATYKAAPVHDPELTSKTFDSFLGALRTHGLDTLICLATRRSGTIRAHIRLLASILDLIRMGAHLVLSHDDGDLHVFFSRNTCNNFIEIVMLQSVDLAYALVHPTAWGVGFSEPFRLSLLSELRPIQTALSSLTDLPEKISRCIMNELPGQSWHMSSDNLHAFISSVNPRNWSAYLISGELQPSVRESRLKSFGTVLPRLEIDAIWCLLAFFGVNATSSPRAADTNNLLYWRLIEKLFVCGVLRHDKDDTAEVVSDASQLLTTNAEVRRLTKLLFTNATAVLPEKDSFMTTLIQRTLFLQSSTVDSQTKRGAFDFPRLFEEKAAKSCSRASWKRIFLICCSRDVKREKLISTNLVTGLFAGDNGTRSLGEISLAPPDVVKTCCGFLVAWIYRLPLKKARRARLNASVKSMIREISLKIGFLNQRHAERSLAQSPGLVSDAAEARGDELLLEATAFLVIFSRLLAYNQEQATFSMRCLIEEVWNLVAEPSMISRQKALIDGTLSHSTLQCLSPVTASGLRIFTAAKMAAVLSLLVLGSEAWAVKLPSDRFISFIPEEATGKADLAYLASCLSSCLSCACADETAREVAISIASMMGLVVSRASQVSNAADKTFDQRFLECVDHLRKESHSVILSSLMLCVDNVLGSTSCSAVEALLLDSLLKLLQVTAMFIRGDNPSTKRARLNQQSPSVNGDMDPWGGIDDALFAGLDLSLAETEPLYQATGLVEVWEKLLLLVEVAKPSDRFSIWGTGHLSSQARNLIARHQSSLCRSLAHVVAAEGETACKELFTRLAKSISAASSSCVTNDGQNSLDDSSYLKSCTLRIVNELVSVSVSSRAVATAISSAASVIIPILLDKFLDVQPIEGLPSCNLARIRAASGDDGVKVELARLFEFAGRRKTRIKENAEKLWRSIAYLGRCILRGEHADRLFRLANSFVNLDSETFDLSHNLSPFTLESECFRRFCLFQGVVSSNSLDLSQVVAAICSGSAAGLAELYQKIARYQPYFDGEAKSSSQNHELAKMMEVFDCYCCVQITVISRILRERASSRSPDDVALLRSLGGVFIKRYLQTKRAGVGTGSGVPNTPMLRLDDLCLRTIEKRYRDFLIFSAHEFTRSGESNPGPLFEALVTVALEGSDEGAYRFCLSFCAKAGRYLTHGKDSIDSSPLQSAIDKYLEGLEPTSMEHSPSDVSVALSKLKCFLINRVIAPRLCVNQAESIKQGLLRMLCCFFETEATEDHDVCGRRGLDVQVLAMVVRGIRVILHNALTSSSISDELLSSVFRCVLALGNLPSTSVDQPTVGRLIDWSSGDHPEAAVYLHAFFDCVRDVGEMIKESSSNSEPMEQYLAGLGELKCNYWAVTPETLSTLPVVSSWVRLVLAERRACPTAAASGSRPAPVNVYASKQGGAEREESLAQAVFVPSPELRRLVNQFLGKVPRRDRESTNVCRNV